MYRRSTKIFYINQRTISIHFEVSWKIFHTNLGPIEKNSTSLIFPPLRQFWSVENDWLTKVKKNWWGGFLKDVFDEIWQMPGDSDTDWWISDQEEELIRLLSDSKENLNSDSGLQTDITQCLISIAWFYFVLCLYPIREKEKLNWFYSNYIVSNLHWIWMLQ